jgi:UDP-N-acetylmuramoyl-L-alanyl-D-glutamate--2,6-diaminopimelate ligase
MRPHTQKRLCVVFGCGGDRDKGKRPIMGEIAAKLADAVYVTDDNPRGEEAAAIRAEVMKGCPLASEIGDRGQAIETAMRALEKGDVLVVAGKGHETGQIAGGRTIPFSDHEAIEAAAGKMGGGA